jgi:hypothetical protein
MLNERRMLLKHSTKVVDQLPKLTSVTFWNCTIVVALGSKIFLKISDFSIVNNRQYIYSEVEWKPVWFAILNTDFS